jgi:invasin-like protein/regulator of chromosome condensation (RCC1) repeat-containing protein/Regulator of Chromosome Condensation (RCC1) repeat protein
MRCPGRPSSVPPLPADQPGLLTALVILLLVTACGSTDGPPDEGIDPALSLVTVSRPLLLPGDTVQVTLQARDAAGQPLVVDGATVVFSSQGGSSGGAFLPVVDQQDGRYTANFVGATPGTAVTIAAQIDGHAITSTLPTLRVVGFTRIVAAGATVVTTEGTTTGGFTCGIITTGDMFCWGISWFGIRGNGTAGNMEPGLEPTLVGGGHRWTEVAAGNFFLCAVAVDGIVHCWGDGDVGQLGNGLQGNPPDITVPAPVSGSATYRAVSIGTSGGACAITLGNEGMCWGGGTWGRLGNGSDALSAVPVAVNGALQFAALSATFSGTCGVAGGNAYCWGYSQTLGLGDAPVPDDCSGSSCAKAPVAVSGGLSFQPIIAMHGNVACAVATDDQAYCWGLGYLGNGTTDFAGTPTLVSGGLSFSSLAAGDGYHCGTVTGGAAYCWGPNKNGRLGNGTTADALVPTGVSGGHAFVQLSAAQDHTCGVGTDGNAYCWGGNDKGELGTRTQAASLTPVRVRLFAP